MDKFYGNSLTQKYINNILLNKEVPFIDFVDDGGFIIKDEVYIYQYQIIQCTSTGYIGDDGAYIVLEIYHPWQRYHKYTRTYTNTEGFYSNKAHRKFGDYLRAFIYNENVNLMGMYNCYDYTSADNINVVRTKDQWGQVSYSIGANENNERQIALVPIKFNKVYTVSLESKSSFYVAPVLYYDNHLIKINNGTKYVDATNMYLAPYVKEMASSSFHEPFTFGINIEDIDIEEEQRDSILKQLYDRQRDLYLMIDLKKSNDTTIIVLEGNYASQKTLDYKVEGDYITSENLSFSPMLQMYQADQQVPYSENLVQYLLANAIYSSKENDYNVKVLRERLGLDPKGDYDNEVRKIVFDKVLQSLTSFKGDIFGYVDCNAEAIL